MAKRFQYQLVGVNKRPVQIEQNRFARVVHVRLSSFTSPLHGCTPDAVQRRETLWNKASRQPGSTFRAKSIAWEKRAGAFGENTTKPARQNNNNSIFEEKRDSFPLVPLAHDVFPRVLADIIFAPRHCFFTLLLNAFIERFRRIGTRAPHHVVEKTPSNSKL